MGFIKNQENVTQKWGDGIKDAIKQMMETLINLYGADIFADERQLRTAMAELFSSDDHKKIRNLLGIALGQMGAYGRLKSWANQEFLATDAMAKEMHEDYDIMAKTTALVMEAIGEIVAASVLQVDQPKAPIIGLPNVDDSAENAVVLDDSPSTFVFGGHRWRILAGDKRRLLIITETAVAFMDWGGMRFRDLRTSDIYRYLNGAFLSSFSAEEHRRILRQSQNAAFLLTREEAVTYFHSDADRIISHEGKGAKWWLIDKHFLGLPHFVSEAGKPNKANNTDLDKPMGIRPALWIKSK